MVIAVIHSSSSSAASMSACARIRAPLDSDAEVFAPAAVVADLVDRDAGRLLDHAVVDCAVAELNCVGCEADVGYRHRAVSSPDDAVVAAPLLSGAEGVRTGRQRDVGCACAGCHLLNLLLGGGDVSGEKGTEPDSKRHWEGTEVDSLV